VRFFDDWTLHDWADLTSIATFALAAPGVAVGLWGYARFRLDRRQKRLKLENYLKGEIGKYDFGRRSILKIVSEIGLTKDEIIQSSFRSKHIARYPFHDEKGLTTSILFQYRDDDHRQV
jgi:hypothetical protein